MRAFCCKDTWQCAKTCTRAMAPFVGDFTTSMFTLVYQQRVWLTPTVQAGANNDIGVLTRLRGAERWMRRWWLRGIIRAPEVELSSWCMPRLLCGRSKKGQQDAG